MTCPAPGHPEAMSDNAQTANDERAHVKPSALLAGMQPAFKHANTGELHLAQLEEGVPADVYGFAGLPDEWVVTRDESGHATALHPDVIAGYWRDARFFSLSQLANVPLDD